LMNVPWGGACDEVIVRSSFVILPFCFFWAPSYFNLK